MVQRWNGRILRSGDIKATHCDDTDTFQILSIVEWSQFVTLLRSNNSGNSNTYVVRSGEEALSNACIAEKVDKENWDLDVVISAVEADKKGLRRNFPELQTERRAANTIMTAGLVSMTGSAKCCIIFDEELKKRDP